MNETSSPIRIASAADEPEILQLLKMMWKEGGWRPLDIDCARAMFARAFDRKGGILAVIGGPGQIRAMMFLLIARAWYTSENHLEELFCYVHPNHRKSDYHKIMIEYAKACSDELSKDAGRKIPLLMGVLTSKRMSAKVRLYRRFFGIPVGAFFMHNAPWVDKTDLSEEDFWRTPNLLGPLLRRMDRIGRNKEKAQ
jgi:hypothetical protein